MNILLSTAYLPPIDYIKYCVCENVFIEYAENFTKRSYRNRCLILTANGTLCLSIPVKKTKGNNTPIKEIEIDYSMNWQLDHWRAIESAYNSSPFFEYYSYMLKPFYFSKKWKYLIDYNSDLLTLIFKMLTINPELNYTTIYQKEPTDKLDLRQLFLIHKNDQNNIENKDKYTYNQVFDYKFEFTPNLSIIDLIFNLGSQSLSYLKGCN